ITYTPPWKYRTTWRGSIPSTVISAVGTPPSAAAATVTPAGSGRGEARPLSSRRWSLTPLSNGKAFCRRIASRFSRCSVLTEDLPSARIRPAAPPAGPPLTIRPRETPARGGGPARAGAPPAGRRATARLAARQVRRRHRIPVIRATGTPQNRSSADSRACAPFWNQRLLLSLVTDVA